jgi:phosphoinositide-3-kinase regulatory subunit 4
MSASTSLPDAGSTGWSNAGIGKRDGKVTEEMDVFSAGCVLLEMWTDGSGVFTLSELYAYREGNLSGIAPVLDSIADPVVKVSLISSGWRAAVEG